VKADAGKRFSLEVGDDRDLVVPKTMRDKQTHLLDAVVEYTNFMKFRIEQGGDVKEIMQKYVDSMSVVMGASLLGEVFNPMEGKMFAPAKKRPRVSVTAPELRTQEGDPQSLTEIFSLQSFDLHNWLQILDDDAAKDYLRDLESRRDMDHAIQVTVDHIGHIKQLRALSDRVERRVAAGEEFLRSMIASSLSRFGKGEWLALVRAKAR